MKQSDLFRRLDETLGAFLNKHGFVGRASEYYVRTDDKGQDTIHIADGKRVRAESHFGVVLSREPKCLVDFTAMIYGVGPQDVSKGSLCSFYLTPVLMTRREKLWACHNVDALEKSLGAILPSLVSIGFPWLESLRDKKTLAESVDPVAAAPAAVVYESCGDISRARRFWGEVKRREIGILEQLLGGRIERMDVLGAKLLVYALLKLDEDVAIQQKLKDYFQFEIATDPLP